MRKAPRRQRSCRRAFWFFIFFAPERNGVVPHTRQSLDSSSLGTTSLVTSGASEGWTWCLTPGKALIIRCGAPRRWSRLGLRRDGRGASHPAKPYSFVAGHHVIGVGGSFGGMDVVPHPPQSLDLSSRGTTSLRSAEASEGWTWCFTPGKALFFRRGAPRRWCRPVLRRAGRGASLPAKPYSFVAGHHVIGAGRCFGGKDVVLHSRQSLVLSS